MKDLIEKTLSRTEKREAVTMYGLAMARGCDNRFNRTYRNEVIGSVSVPSPLGQTREISARWLIEYNELRPHDALGSTPPVICATRSGGIPNLERRHSCKPGPSN